MLRHLRPRPSPNRLNQKVQLCCNQVADPRRQGRTYLGGSLNTSRLLVSHDSLLPQRTFADQTWGNAADNALTLCPSVAAGPSVQVTHPLGSVLNNASHTALPGWAHCSRHSESCAKSITDPAYVTGAKRHGADTTLTNQSTSQVVPSKKSKRIPLNA
jgi:hypothetical protein